MKTNDEGKVERFYITRNLYLCIMSLYELSDKLFGSIYVAFMRSRNITIGQISKLFAFEQILLAIFDLPTGTISDKIGRKKTASIGFIIWGIGVLEFAFAHNFWLFVPSMVLMALGLALISGAPSAWLVDQMIYHGVYEKRNQLLPKMQAIVQFFAIIASILAYLLIGIGQQIPILVAACVSILAGIVGLVVGKDNYGEVKGNNIWSSLSIHFIEFIKERKFVLLSIRNILCYISFVVFVLYWQIYATEVIKIEVKYLPFILMAFMFLLMAGNYTVSLLSKRVSSFNISILGIIISMIGFILLYMFNTTSSFMLAACLIEFGFGLERSATSTWMCDYIKSETRATYASIFSTLQAVSGFIFINIMGLIIDLFGLNMAWIAAVLAMCLDITILFYFIRHFKTIKTNEDSMHHESL